MFHQTKFKTCALVLLIAAAVLYANLTGYFGLELIAQAAILAILAVSLDLVAGYGGMVSLCHGAIYGLGAYVFASLTVLAGVPVPLAIVAALVACALFGAAVGAVTSRTRGIFFIMATLAFNQMVYVLIFESRWLGGDDGLPGVPRLDLGAVGLNLDKPVNFAMFAIAVAVLAYGVAAFVLRSGFGRSIVGVHANESRMRALGLSVRGVKCGAFAVSGAIAGLAGTLAAQQTMFVSPEMMNWTVSGEILMVVILGGLGTLVGPVAGAGIWVFLKHEVSSITSYWHIVVGGILIAAILLGGRGIYGELEALVARLSRRRPAADRGGPAEPAGAVPADPVTEVRGHA